MPGRDYDIFVIGGGSAGVRAARLAAAKELKVGLAEEYRMGGTCVIRGCVPKKLFAYAAAYGQSFGEAAAFGWQSGKAQFSWPVLRAAKDKEIARLEGLYRQNAQKAGAEIFHQRAVLVDKHTVRLADGRELRAKVILLAAGARPVVPQFPGAELCLTSNEIFNLEQLPKHIVIAGGGYIAVEFASILRGLGVEVTLVYRGDVILRRFDGDLRRLLQQALAERGINIITNAVIENVRKTAAGGKKTPGLAVRLSNGAELQAGQALLALGRQPFTAGLGLENAGVKTAANGAVAVNRFLQTNIENIYAAGDIIGRVELTPVAIHEAMCFVKTVCDGQKTEPDYQGIPTAVFTEPEIGTVGLTEEEAAQKFPSLDVYRAHFRPLRAAVSGSESKMLMKLLADGTSGRIVGAHILGADAGEMAQLLAVALKGGVSKSVFDATMALHPSAAEELVTMYQPSYRYKNGKRTD